MAKDKFDFDSDLDFDLDKELGGIDFGESDTKPPKNKREAVQRTLKKAGKGFRDEILQNKLKTAGKLAKNSIPSSISAEFNDIAGVASDVKSIVTDSIDEVKKQGAGLSRALGKLLPENSKLAKLLGKVSDKLDDHVAQSQQESKEQRENTEIQQGILATLGEMKDKSHTDAMLQQTMQNKQFASNIEMLKNIYAETKLNRLFTYEITNSYYRKSLELQYKQLFTQREILELQKLMYTSQKNQLESLVLNTALPDFLKARSTEVMKYTIAQKGRDLIATNLFKPGSAFSRIGDNIKKRAQNFMSGLKEGLGGARDMTDMLSDVMQMQKDMGMNPAEMAGSSIANFLNQYLGGKIGKKIASTKLGKNAIFNFKEAYADPKKFLKELGDKYSNAKGPMKFLGKAARFASGFASNPTKLEAEYQQKDLDESALFDNRAHQSITKVIPGLLSKIYAETKMTRLGLKIKGDSTVHEIAFDNKDDMFKTKKRMVQDINKEIKQSLNRDFKGFAAHLHYLLKEAGCGLSGPECSILNRALLNYSMQPGSYTAASTLYDPDFLKFIQDPKLADKMAKNGPKLREYFLENPDQQDWASTILQSMKSSLPNLSKRFQDLQKSGHSNLLVGMKVAKRGRSGNLVANSKGVDRQIYRNYSDDLGEALLIGGSSSIRGQQIANEIEKKATGLYDKVTNMTAEDVAHGVVSAGHKAAGYVRQGMNTVDNLVQQAQGTKAYQQAAAKASAWKKKFDNSRAGKLTAALGKAANRNANKVKDRVMNSKVVQSVMNSRSAQKVAEFFVEKGRSAQDFFNLPESEMEQQLVAKYRKAQASAREFINKTKTAVTEDTDFKNFQHDIQEGMADIASIAKKIWRGEATDEDIANFQAAMKVRAKSLGQTAKSVGQRGYAAGKKTYGRAKVKAAEIKSMIQTNVNGFLETEKGQKVLEKFRQAKAKYGTVHDKVGNKLGPVRTAVKNALGKAADVTTEEIDNLIDELDRVDRGEATTGSSKVLSAYDKVKAGMGTARDAMSDPRKALEAGEKLWGKIKKLFEKPVSKDDALKAHAEYIAARKKEGFKDEEIMTDFMQWCKAFHIKIKGEGPFGNGIRGFFQWTRKKDKEIWKKAMGGAMLAPFRFVGGMLSNTRIGNTIGKIPLLGKATGLSGGGSVAAGAGNLAAKAGGLAMSAGLGLGKAATEMMPAPMRMLVQAPFTAIGAMATGMGEILKFMGFRTKQEDAEKKKQEKLKKKQEKQDKEKNKSGGWLNRLKFWDKKKGDEKKEKGEKKGFLDRIKQMKTPLTIMGGILGVFGLCKALNISFQDVVDGVKTAATTIVDIGGKILSGMKWLYDAFGGGMTGIMGLLATYFTTKFLGKKLLGFVGKQIGRFAMWGGTKLALGAGAIGGKIWNTVTNTVNSFRKPSVDSKVKTKTNTPKTTKTPTVKTPTVPKKTPTPKPTGPVKPPPGGAGLFAGIIAKIRSYAGVLGSWLASFLEKIKDKATKACAVIEKNWKSTVSKLKSFVKIVQRPKILAKLGAKVAMFVAKVVTATATISSGVLSWIGAALIAYDVVMICYYYFWKKKSFLGALSMHFLGVDLTDSEDVKSLGLTEQDVAEDMNLTSEEGLAKENEQGSVITERGSGENANVPKPGYLTDGIKSLYETGKSKFTGWFDNVTGEHNKKNIEQNDSVISLLTQIRDILAAGISVSPGSSSATFASNTGYSSSSSSSGSSSTSAGGSYSNELTPLNTADPNFSGNPRAAKAADFTTNLVKTKNKDNKAIGECASYVNQGLRAFGINQWGNGWEADKGLTKLGWERVWDGSTGENFKDFKPQKGDVISIGRPNPDGTKVSHTSKKTGKVTTGPQVLPDNVAGTSGQLYGHTAIFNGSQWVSDFRQSQASAYTTRGDDALKDSYRYATVLRMPKELGGDSNISSYDRAKYSNRATSLSSSVASKTSTSGNTKSVINIDTSSVSNILQESYKVHVASRDLLQEIRDAVVANAQTTQAAAQQAQQPANNVMPESAIRLQHNSYNFG